MVILQAYVDDSSSHVGDKRLFLAGYINSAERWIEFSQQWESALHSHPRISHLHMVEAQNLRGEFRGWSEDARDQKVLALARVIRGSNPWSIECSVSRDEYARILEPVSPAPLKSPYFSCFWGIIDTAARYHRSLGIDGVPPVDFIFDDQGGVGDEAVMWYRWLKDEIPPDLRVLLGSTPIFRSDQQIIPLQAADMLAWHLRRMHERKGLEQRPAMRLLIASGSHVARYADSSTLESIAKKMRRVPGVFLIKERRDWRRAKKSMLEAPADAPPPSMNRALLHLDVALIRIRRWWQTRRRRR